MISPFVKAISLRYIQHNVSCINIDADRSFEKNIVAFTPTPQFIPEKVQSVPRGYFFLPKFAKIHFADAEKNAASLSKSQELVRISVNPVPCKRGLKTPFAWHWVYSSPHHTASAGAKWDSPYVLPETRQAVRQSLDISIRRETT